MIPVLAFSDRAVTPVRDVGLVRDRLNSLMPKLTEFSVLGERSEFASSKAKLDLPDMTLIALSHTPYQLNRIGCASTEIWIPLSGQMAVSDGQSQFHYGANRAFFCTSEIRNIRTTTSSALGLRFDMHKLNAVRSAMVGSPSLRHVPTHSRIVDLEVQGLNFLALFKNLARQINELQADVVALERLATADSFYRLSASLLEPHLLQDGESPKRWPDHTQKRIAELCEFLRAHLGDPISLTEMEQVSGLSARVLQYNFQKTFGMRPKQWLRQQRLHAARAVILKSGERVKLTALAYDFCFPSPSVFSRAYQMEFGELPSETLAGKSD